MTSYADVGGWSIFGVKIHGGFRLESNVPKTRQQNFMSHPKTCIMCLKDNYSKGPDDSHFHNIFLRFSLHENPFYRFVGIYQKLFSYI